MFHDGTPLTAEDVIYSLDRIRKPPRGIVSPRKGLLGNIASIEAGGPLTVVIRLTEPQPDFLFMVSNPYNVIVPKKVCEPLDAQGQGMKRQIVGTGPFRLTQSIDGQIYELTRFDGYFGDKAYLDKIQFFPIKGEVERGAALQGKRIDASFFFRTRRCWRRCAKSPASPNCGGRRQRSSTSFPNVQRKPFDDIRVREALSLAVDREAFIKTVGTARRRVLSQHRADAAGQSVRLSVEQIKQFGGYDTLPGLGGNVAANRQRAISLLEQAGVPKDFKIVIITRGDLPAFRNSAINVAGQLKTIGLDATVDVRDTGSFYTMETKGDFQLVAHSVAMGGSVPDQIFGEGYTSYGGRNYGNWKDDALDNLFREQSREAGPQKRTELIKKFQLEFLKTYYQVNLAWVGYGAAHLNTVKGWVALPDIYANMQMDKVWLDA